MKNKEIMKNFRLMITILGMISFMYIYTDQQFETERSVLKCASQVKIDSKIKLFFYHNCPYCDKVHSFLKEQNLLDQVELINAELSENKELLRLISKRTQTPYIVDVAAGVKMAESEDIIEYFIKKYNIQFVVQTSLDSSLRMQNNNDFYNSPAFLSQVQASKKPVVILVSTTWCPPCKIFKPLFLEITQAFADKCEIICLDGDLNSDIVLQLGVRSYPSIVCYKNGQQINPENYRSKDGLIKLIDQLLQD